jgi:putrescine aminotransferase
VSNIGHRHPNVVRAIKDQTDKYLHLMVYGELVQNPPAELAKRLADTLPGPLNSTYFVNSGSEAVEGALKLAKRFSGRFEIINCQSAYHGSSMGALSVGGNELYKNAFRPLLPGVKTANFGDTEDLGLITTATAAFIVETVQGEAGVRIAPKEYWQAVRKRCTETGTLLILDEIQTGFGRTGKFWAFEHYDIAPDIVVCAKGMGGGMPIGAFISSKSIMSVLKNNPVLGHITTFGGHPVSCAASLATLNTIFTEGLMDEVEEKAQIFVSNLSHPLIKEIRYKGLMMALEFKSFEVLKPIIDRALINGVLTDWFLNCDNALRIAPPLTITQDQIQSACGILIQSMNQVSDQSE